MKRALVPASVSELEKAEQKDDGWAGGGRGSGAGHKQVQEMKQLQIRDEQKQQDSREEYKDRARQSVDDEKGLELWLSISWSKNGDSIQEVCTVQHRAQSNTVHSPTPCIVQHRAQSNTVHSPTPCTHPNDRTHNTHRTYHTKHRCHLRSLREH
jgi:hypothetical protein